MIVDVLMLLVTRSFLGGSGLIPVGEAASRVIFWALLVLSTVF